MRQVVVWAWWECASRSGVGVVAELRGFCARGGFKRWHWTLGGVRDAANYCLVVRSRRYFLLLPCAGSLSWCLLISDCSRLCSLFRLGGLARPSVSRRWRAPLPPYCCPRNNEAKSTGRHVVNGPRWTQVCSTAPRYLRTPLVCCFVLSLCCSSWYAAACFDVRNCFLGAPHGRRFGMCRV